MGQLRLLDSAFLVVDCAKPVINHCLFFLVKVPGIDQKALLILLWVLLFFIEFW